MRNTYQSSIPALRHEFPQLHNSRSKWLHASEVQTLIFISFCTLKFNSLHRSLLPCSRWVPSCLLPDSSPFWGLPAAASPWCFTSCQQSVWITAQVTVTVLQQEWQGRKRVTVHLTAQKNRSHLGILQMSSLGDGYFPAVCCSNLWEHGYGMGELFLRRYTKIINGYWKLRHWRKHLIWVLCPRANKNYSDMCCHQINDSLGWLMHGLEVREESWNLKSA